MGARVQGNGSSLQRGRIVDPSGSNDFNVTVASREDSSSASRVLFLHAFARCHARVSVVVNADAGTRHRHVARGIRWHANSVEVVAGPLHWHGDVEVQTHHVVLEKGTVHGQRGCRIDGDRTAVHGRLVIHELNSRQRNRSLVASGHSATIHSHVLHEQAIHERQRGIHSGSCDTSQSCLVHSHVHLGHLQRSVLPHEHGSTFLGLVVRHHRRLRHVERASREDRQSTTLLCAVLSPAVAHSLPIAPVHAEDTATFFLGGVLGELVAGDVQGTSHEGDRTTRHFRGIAVER
mmetsp:Transcript_22734/g.53921  ORF Transcript_22734/g.53921 Transcript_22734/m.53921 type:complete len:291 (-) Transcript_22734:2023-2895(-)